MSELQTADDGIVLDAGAEPEPAQIEATPEATEPAEVGSELATDKPVEDEKNTDGAQKAINKQHYKFKEQQRRADAFEAQLKEVNERLATFEAPKAVDIPAMPDTWDDNYAPLMDARDKAIHAKALRDHSAQADADRGVIAQEEARQVEVKKAQVLQDQFAGNAKRLGISSEVLDSAQDAVINYGITPDIANAIIGDTDGPLIVQHLAANPLEMEALVHGSLFEAGQKWAEIKAKAASMKTKPSAAPAPADSLGGRAAPQSDPALDGMTFE